MSTLLAPMAAVHNDLKDEDTTSTFITIGKAPENTPGLQAKMIMMIIMKMMDNIVMFIGC